MKELKCYNLSPREPCQERQDYLIYYIINITYNKILCNRLVNFKILLILVKYLKKT